MTMILAINLSDRIYLAADSLVSRRSGERIEGIGYTLKLVSIASEQSMIEANNMTPAELSKNPPSSISCMFAGNRSFAHYIFTMLNRGLDSGELNTDINELLKQIDPYLRKAVPKYPGSANDTICKLIVAGCSNAKNSVKPFRLDNLDKVLGSEAGSIQDLHAVHGIQFGFANVPDQKVFSYKIDHRDGSFEIEEIGDMYSVISGGSRNLTPAEKAKLLRFFLTKRNSTDEGMDVVNFIRNQFSDTIGGAITLGEIDYQKRLIYFGYDLDKSGKLHHSNWSFRIDNLPEKTRFVAIGPNGEEYDLIESFYGFRGDYSDTSLELSY